MPSLNLDALNEWMDEAQGALDVRDDRIKELEKELELEGMKKPDQELLDQIKKLTTENLDLTQDLAASEQARKELEKLKSKAQDFVKENVELKAKLEQYKAFQESLKALPPL